MSRIPAIFATLALWSAIYGFSRLALVGEDLIYVPPSASWTRIIGAGDAFGLPSSVIVFLLFAALACFFLQFIQPGWFLRAIGDNPLKVRQNADKQRTSMHAMPTRTLRSLSTR